MEMKTVKLDENADEYATHPKKKKIKNKNNKKCNPAWRTRSVYFSFSPTSFQLLLKISFKIF